MTKKKTILILGAGGLLGNIIYDKLSKLHNIIGFSHKKSKKRNIIKSNYSDFSPRHIFFIQSADIIINCIGENSDENKMKKINITILKKISIQINKIKKKKIFIHISTCGVYGNLIDQLLIDESTKPKPETKYSKTKFNGEEILINQLKNNTKLIILRPSQVIGTTMKNTSLKKLYYFVKKKLFFLLIIKNQFFLIYLQKTYY